MPRLDIEARKRELARIAAEIDELKRLIEADRELYPVAQESGTEGMEEWQTMSSEEQIEWIGNVRRFMEEHREELAEIPDVAGTFERLQRLSKRHAALIRLEDEAQELILQSHADEAEAATRLIVAMMEIMEKMEEFTEDDWHDIPPDKRAGMVDLLNAWHAGQREVCLSQLPIELRRRYE